MGSRFEIHPARYDLHRTMPDLAPAEGEHFWHRRSDNGEVVYTAESFTRHEDAVEAIRRAVTDIALQDFDLSLTSFDRLYAPHLTFFDCTLHDGIHQCHYTERRLFPAPFDESNEPIRHPGGVVE